MRANAPPLSGDDRSFPCGNPSEFDVWWDRGPIRCAFGCDPLDDSQYATSQPDFFHFVTACRRRARFPTLTAGTLSSDPEGQLMRSDQKEKL